MPFQSNNSYKGSKSTNLKPFSTNVPFLYPQKMPENQRFSDVFSGYRNGTLGKNWLNCITFCL